MKKENGTKLLRSVPRALSLLLCLVLALSLAAPARAAYQYTDHPDLEPCSNNWGSQDYGRWSRPVSSYLYENENGGLTRVEYVADTSPKYPDAPKIVISNYDDGFVFQSRLTLPMPKDMPIWGGFYAGENYNFLIFGQENKEQDDNKEVIRVVKYSKDWKWLRSASLRGANTTVPFDAGSLRCAEYGGYLYIRTSHEMYTSSDGYNHQANLMLNIRESDMTITDSYYKVMNSSVGYVSHSFNQFILVDAKGRIVTLDHGDAHPRSAVLMRYYAPAGQDSFQKEVYTQIGGGWYTVSTVEQAELAAFPGQTGDNDTGCCVGGLAETARGYVAACSNDGQGGKSRTAPRDVYLAFVGDDLSVKTVRVTTGANASAPQLVSTGPEGGYVLWNLKETVKSQYSDYTWTEMGDTLYYAAYTADGTVGPVKTVKHVRVSDCAPIVYDGRAVWYASVDGVPTFYALDASGVQTMIPDARAKFTDAEDGAFYLNPVAWAVNRGITTGKTATAFRPGLECSHSEILTFLWRAAGEPKTGAQSPIAMNGKEFYYDAVRWAYERGMIDSSFNPDAKCTRADAVRYIWYAFGKPEAGYDGRFTDVPAGSPVGQAVAWAVDNGVTTGTAATRFSPDRICDRGTIVTFLYRAYSQGASNGSK